MTAEKVAIAADHAGFELKEKLATALRDKGYEVVDLGTDSTESVDYPDFGHKLAETVERGEAGRGVLICGTGIGVSITANRHKGVRAALCTSSLMARLARQHNDANVLVLGARIIGEGTAIDCLDGFLEAEFEGGRHARRLEKI